MSNNMSSFSVIVTACNMESVIGRTLASVEAAIAKLPGQDQDAITPRSEIVVVEDGSKDSTWQAIEAQAAGKAFYKLIRRGRPSSPSCARNVGVEASTGQLLFFLDGDDLFYPSHIETCLWALNDPNACFVKTQVHVDGPIHPDWRERINHSLIINLCVRRECHFAVGGFPDYHLFERRGNEFGHRSDIFYKFEDMYYNQLITGTFPGVAVNQETVEYVRHPGNGLDRQYERYQHPFGSFPAQRTEDENFRLALCELLIQRRLENLRRARDEWEKNKEEYLDMAGFVVPSAMEVGNGW